MQDRTYLGLLEASGPQVASWLRSASFSAMMTSLFPPLPDSTSLQQPRAVQQLELTAQKDCQSAFEAVRRFEASHNLVLQNMGMSFLQQRGAMVGSILQKGGELQLPDEVVHDAVLLLDRAGSTGVQVGVACRADCLLPVRYGCAVSAANYGLLCMYCFVQRHCVARSPCMAQAPDGTCSFPGGTPAACRQGGSC